VISLSLILGFLDFLFWIISKTEKMTRIKLNFRLNMPESQGVGGVFGCPGLQLLLLNDGCRSIQVLPWKHLDGRRARSTTKAKHPLALFR
jgi:hypothetical protein